MIVHLNTIIWPST